MGELDETRHEYRPLPMRSRILLIDHHDNPGDDLASTHLANRGFQIEWVRPFMGQALPPLRDDVTGAVIYGGAQNMTELNKYPFLHDELDWIEGALATNLPLLGICLGGQLLSHALGGTISAHADGLCEFGYYEVKPEIPNIRPEDAWFTEPMRVTQAHYEQFTIPDGAVRLARGDCFENQAFRYRNNAYGLQFHPEVTVNVFTRWQNSDWAFYGHPGSQNRAEQNALMPTADAIQGAWFRRFLDCLFGIEPRH